MMLAGCKKDNVDPQPSDGFNVERKNRASLIVCSETWCSSCGSFGVDVMDSAMHHEKSSMTIMKICNSSTPAHFNNPLFNLFKIEHSVQYVPTFIINHSKMWAGPPAPHPSLHDTKLKVMGSAQMFNSNTVVAGVSIRKEVFQDSILVKTKVLFFEDADPTSTYYLGIYLIEDSVAAPQSGVSSSNFFHRNLFRVGNSPFTYFGNPLINNSKIHKNDVFLNDTVFKVNPIWIIKNIKVVAIIWKDGPTGKRVVNSNVLF